jgi:predicted enzyme involved in methoxymalonyl-ACP biosynthesis
MLRLNQPESPNIGDSIPWDTDGRFSAERKDWSDGNHKELVVPLLQKLFPGCQVKKSNKIEDMKLKIDYVLTKKDHRINIASRTRHFYSYPTKFNVYASNDITIRETELCSKSDFFLYCVLSEDESKIARWHLVDLKKLIQLIKKKEIRYDMATNCGDKPFKFFIIKLDKLRSAKLIKEEQISQNFSTGTP